ncbi:unnamed protein product [Mesocestoides corti]|uniref:CBF1-interacting co-repressor CIR N-terminal domain-containing protein n=1 Tax=Mesocestoides corti TaxID=53468 RepID=A0A0R3ULL7_MESCO|nr:unnamed protein product [Mesocestoides corti]
MLISQVCNNYRLQRTLFATNKEYEEEKRNEKETHEKKLGILKYLSESVDGTPAVKPWWFVAPDRGKKIEGNKCNLMLDEVDVKRKQKSDPLFHMRKVEEEFARIREAKQAKEAKERAAAAQMVSSCSSLFPNDIKAPGLKRPHAAIEKYEAESKSEKRKRLEKLRADRLSRERSERERAAVLLCRSMGLSASSVEAVETPILDERQLPFNSAFNPELSSLAAERRNAHRERRTSK